MDRGIETFIQVGKQCLRRYEGATVELTRRGGLLVLQCQAVVPVLLAPVDVEPAGEALDFPPIDEEMERELMGREEVKPPVAIEVPAPDEPTSDERRHHGHTFAVSTLVQHLRPSSRETDRHVSRSQYQPGTPVIQCDLLLPEDGGRCSNGHNLGGHRHNVQTEMIAIPLEKKGNRDRLQVAAWPHSHSMSDIPK